MQLGVILRNYTCLTSHPRSSSYIHGHICISRQWFLQQKIHLNLSKRLSCAFWWRTLHIYESVCLKKIYSTQLELIMFTHDTQERPLKVLSPRIFVHTASASPNRICSSNVYKAVSATYWTSLSPNAALRLIRLRVQQQEVIFLRAMFHSVLFSVFCFKSQLRYLHACLSSLFAKGIHYKKFKSCLHNLYRLNFGIIAARHARTLSYRKRLCLAADVLVSPPNRVSTTYIHRTSHKSIFAFIWCTGRITSEFFFTTCTNILCLLHGFGSLSSSKKRALSAILSVSTNSTTWVQFWAVREIVWVSTSTWDEFTSCGGKEVNFLLLSRTVSSHLTPTVSWVQRCSSD